MTRDTARPRTRPLRWWSIVLLLAVTGGMSLWLAGEGNKPTSPRPVRNHAFPSLPAGGNPAVVWAVGDGADGSAAAGRVAVTIRASRPDRVLYLGDV